jgi:hypothetical protein
VSYVLVCLVFDVWLFVHYSMPCFGVFTLLSYTSLLHQKLAGMRAIGLGKTRIVHMSFLLCA